MKTTKIIELQLKYWPNEMTHIFLVPEILHNLVSVAKICDAGGNLLFSQHVVEVEFNDIIIAKGWCDPTNRLWRIPITSKGDTHNIPHTPKEAYDPKYGVVFNISINALYECKTTEQLAIFLHTILGSHPQATLLESIKVRYLRGCPGLSKAAIQKCINFEPATKISQMKMVQARRRSTPAKSNRRRKPLQPRNQRAYDVLDAVNLTDQEPDNKKIQYVFMSTADVKGLIASD